MKAGFRKPSFSKSLKARTTGKLKRNIKRNSIPGYGRKGTGLLHNPTKAIYNRGYNRSTTSIFDNNHNKAKAYEKYESSFSDMPLSHKIGFIIDLIYAILYGGLCLLGACGIGYVIFKILLN